MNKKNKLDSQSICFGLNRMTDEESLAVFLQLFSNTQLLKVLLPRMQDNEILNIVDSLSLVLRRHLSEAEYHELFLKDPKHDSPNH
jgi:TorA maturation chaperone TorD